MSSATEPSTGRTIQVSGGIELFYLDAGESRDRPPLLLLHGGGPGAGGWSNFSRNIGPLSRNRRVLVFDLPQYGRSTKVRLPDDEVYPSSYVRALTEALEQLGVARLDVVGNSLGAGVACLLAHRSPQLVRRMVLMGPGGVQESVMTPVPMDALRRMFTYYNPGPPSRAAMKEILESLLYDRESLTEELLDERYEASIEPETLALFGSMRKQNLTNVTEFMHTLTQPTLVVFGLDDRVTPFDSALKFVKTLPNCELLVLPKAGHWVMWELPDRFNKAVDDFLLAG
ncbi:alpha/beta fold hydrolase [Actinomadura geliboluensis]|uniref:alpha/beta fold hydrolase n=1 Tax=Actinomadura geliboluensis TaxID=882440 RepID=UPI0036AE4BB4